MECRLKFRIHRPSGKRRKYVMDLQPGYRYFVGQENGSLKFGGRAQEECFGFFKVIEGLIDELEAMDKVS